MRNRGSGPVLFENHTLTVQQPVSVTLFEKTQNLTFMTQIQVGRLASNFKLDFHCYCIIVNRPTNNFMLNTGNQIIYQTHLRKHLHKQITHLYLLHKRWQGGIKSIPSQRALHYQLYSTFQDVKTSISDEYLGKLEWIISTSSSGPPCKNIVSSILENLNWATHVPTRFHVKDRRGSGSSAVKVK